MLLQFYICYFDSSYFSHLLKKNSDFCIFSDSFNMEKDSYFYIFLAQELSMECLAVMMTWEIIFPEMLVDTEKRHKKYISFIYNTNMSYAAYGKA